MNLKSINWKKVINNGLKAMIDTKNLGLLVLMGFTLYGIGWDTVLRPSLEQLKSKDTAIEEQRKTLAEKKDLQSQYGVWEQQLKSLNTELVAIQPNDQPNLIALTVADGLRRLVSGEDRDSEILPSLEPPHDKRTNVILKPLGESTTVDLLKSEGDAAAGQEQQGGSESDKNQNQADAKAPGGEGGIPTSLPVQRFDYELKVSGTYPALMDVLNELVIRKKLVKINTVSITRPPTGTDADEPDAEVDPLYPVPLEMTVSLSIYLYVSNASPHV